MLYQKKLEETLSEELFKNPSGEYRGAPFWAWNCKVTKEQIDDQTEIFCGWGWEGPYPLPDGDEYSLYE